MMVDLPTPSPWRALSEQPNSGISPGAIAQQGDSLAQGLQSLSTGLDNLDVPIAEQAGRDAVKAAVTRNPDGSLSVDTPASSLILGKGGTAYAETVANGFMAAQRTAIDNDMVGLRQQFAGDPQAFARAAGNYTDELAARYPGPLGSMVEQYGNSLSSQHYTNMVDQHARLDIEARQKAQSDRLNYIEGALNGLAGNGGIGSKAYNDLLTERSSMQDALQNSPLSTYNQQQRANDDTIFSQSIATAAAVGHGRTIYGQTGNLSAAIDSTQAELAKVPGLSEMQQLRALGEVSMHLRGLDATRQQANQLVRDQADTVILQSKGGGNVPATTFETLRQGLVDRRLYAKAAEVQAQSLFQSAQPVIMGGTGAEAVDALRKINTAATQGAAAGSGQSGGSADVGTIQRAIIGQESGGNPNASKSVTGATGVGQIQPATFRQYAKSGESIDSPADNLAVSNRIVADYTQKFGGDPARVAVAYFSGEGNVAPAGSATPYIKNKSDPTGKTTASYVADVLGRVSGSGMSADGSPAVAYKMLLQETNAAFNAHAEKLWNGMTTTWDNKDLPGAQPTPAEVSDLKTMVPYITDPKLRNDITQRLGVEAAKDGFSRMPSTQRNDMLAAYQALGQQGQLDASTRLVLGGLQDQATHLNALVTADPVAYGQRILRPDVQKTLPPVMPLDASSPQTFAAGLQARQTMKGAAQKFDPATGDQVLTGGDQANITDVFQRGTGQQAANVFSGLLSLTDPEQAAAMSDKKLTGSIEGLSRSSDPAKQSAAYGFMDAEYRRNPQQFDATFGSDALVKLRSWQSDVAFDTPEQMAKKAMAADDPSTIAAKKSMGDVADKALEGVSADAVVKKFATSSIFNPLSWGSSPSTPIGETATSAGSAGALLSDYRAAYRQMFQETGDAGTADKFAMERLQQKWGGSPINGGRVMAYPPERYYPPVGGSYTYIRDQLDTAVKAAMGTSPDAGRVNAAEHILVPDERTEKDIANKRPPSYRVVSMGADTRYHALEATPGLPLRFRADSGTSALETEGRFTTQRSTNAAGAVPEGLTGPM